MAEVHLRNVKKTYGDVRVIHGVSCDIADGEFVVVVGPSGCGKSTLLRMVAGLEEITEGQIAIGGRVVNDVEPKDRDIAMVFQNYALYPHMSVFDNMAYGLKIRGIPKDRQEEAIARVAALLQIEPFLKRKPGQLSGGQRQRVAMGRALVRDPELFLFDEPLSNLDAKLRVDMRTEMKKLHHRVGKTTVYVTHDQVEAMTLASRIAVMHLGEVQQFAEPETVYNRPANIFVAGFMGSPSMNFINAEFSSAEGKPAVTVALSNGNTAALPLHNGAAERADRSSRQVILGIRPEHLSRYNADLHASRPGIATLTAPVGSTTSTGAVTIAILRLGDREIVGRFSPDEAPKMGEDMRLAVDMTRACLFDPATQRLI